MGVNNVKLANGETLVDLRDSTVTPASLAEGTTAYDASGERITGEMPTTSVLYTEQKLTEAQQVQARQNIGASPELFYVTMTDNSDGTYTADKTFSEVLRAYVNGCAVLCNIVMAELPLILPLSALVDGIALFAGLIDGATISVLMSYDGSVQANIVQMLTEENMPAYLPNPYDLRIYDSDGNQLGAYDGSKNVRVTIPSVSGKDGYTPVRGVDYWTAADQESIVQQVITALGTPVFGTVDADNNIILTGALADGTYTLKYEDANGIQTEIGTLTMGVGDVEYLSTYGTINRNSADNSIYYSNSNGTSYKIIYQTTGITPLSSGSATGTPTEYYPLAVPNGKTKVTVSFPSLASDKKLIMGVESHTLSNGIYTRVASAGWLAEGTYTYEFGSAEYITLKFRNNNYGGLDNYDFTGFTVTWE